MLPPGSLKVKDSNTVVKADIHLFAAAERIKCNTIAGNKLFCISVSTVRTATLPREGVPHVHWIISARTVKATSRRVGRCHHRVPSYVVDRFSLMHLDGRI